MLSLFANDPKEAARWLLRELGWSGLNDQFHSHRKFGAKVAAARRGRPSANRAHTGYLPLGHDFAPIGK